MSHPGIEAIRGFLGAEPEDPTKDLLTRRADLAALTGSQPAPDGVLVEPLEFDGIRAERLTPPLAPDGQLILYLHGGGYCLGSIDGHRGLAGALAVAARTTVVNLDYRLAPEDPFPCAVDDVLEAFDELSPARIALAGDSAGGGLSLAAAVALRDRGRAQPKALGLLSPWTDLTQSSPTFAEVGDRDPMVTKGLLDQMADAYANGHDVREPMISPLFAELAGLPPMRIDVGTEELLLDDSRVLAERARAAGVEVELEVWPEMIHVFQAFPASLVPEAAQSIERIGRFLADRLAP
ncbi:MAG: alpha/beta hydrolase [Acidimicrobiales bacterium]